MTDAAKSEFVSGSEPKNQPEKTEDIKKDQPEVLATNEDLTKGEVANPRRTALSKREIMEQLSRERFPWDE